MQTASALLLVLATILGILIAVLIMLVIGACIYLGGVAMYNSIHASRKLKKRVEPPTFGGAMLIVFLHMLASTPLSFVFSLLLGFIGAALRQFQFLVQIYSYFFSMILSIMVTTVLGYWLLPAKFIRALLVSVYAHIIGFIFGMILWVIIFFVVLIAVGSRGGPARILPW
jgi:hypothetical protein